MHYFDFEFLIWFLNVCLFTDYVKSIKFYYFYNNNNNNDNGLISVHPYYAPSPDIKVIEEININLNYEIVKS